MVGAAGATKTITEKVTFNITGKSIPVISGRYVSKGIKNIAKRAPGLAKTASGIGWGIAFGKALTEYKEGKGSSVQRGLKAGVIFGYEAIAIVTATFTARLIGAGGLAVGGGVGLVVGAATGAAAGAIAATEIFSPVKEYFIRKIDNGK